MDPKINIPHEELDQVIQKSITRGRLKMKTKKKKFTVLKAVACAGLVLVGSLVASVNAVPAFADALKEIPGMSGIVRIIEFDRGVGVGGKVTDGQELGDIVWAREGDRESVTLKLFTEDGVAPAPGYFEIVEEQYPNRLVISINGVRRVSVPDWAAPENSLLLTDMYRMVTLDDSMQRIVLSFATPVDYTVAETENGGIYIAFEEKQTDSLAPVYSVRTASEAALEPIAVIEEILLWEHGVETARLIHDAKGDAFVEVGYFETEAEAQAMKVEFEENLGRSLFIEERGESDIPANLK
ncbi:MAG: hypothetical protein FH749_08715 [Firmicutes bacterium]|nr:hypothetical protein [Bacillota bacterium]